MGGSPLSVGCRRDGRWTEPTGRAASSASSPPKRGSSKRPRCGWNREAAAYWVSACAGTTVVQVAAVPITRDQHCLWHFALFHENRVVIDDAGDIDIDVVGAAHALRLRHHAALVEDR